MAAPYNFSQSKLERAICAYLVECGAGSFNDVSPSNSVAVSSYPNTTAISQVATPEIQMTGIMRIPVHISIKGSAAKVLPNPVNEESVRVDFDTRVKTTCDLLMVTDAAGQTLRQTAQNITDAGRALAVAVDGTDAAVQLADNNSDMVDFTCQAWYDMGYGFGEQNIPGTSWETVLMFEAVCSNKNVD